MNRSDIADEAIFPGKPLEIGKKLTGMIAGVHGPAELCNGFCIN